MADPGPGSSGTTTAFDRFFEVAAAVQNALANPTATAAALREYKDRVLQAAVNGNRRIVLQEASDVRTVIAKVASPFGAPSAAAQREMSGVDTAVPVQAAIGNALNDSPIPRTAVADPVDVFTGQLVHRIADFKLSGAGIDFEFVRTYRSEARYPNGPLGACWDHSLNFWIREVGTNALAVASGELREDRYVLQTPRSGALDQTPYFAMASGGHSVVVPQGTSYVLRRPNGTSIRFEVLLPGTHRVKRIQDRFGNFLAFSYPSDEEIRIEVNDPQRLVRIHKDYLGRIDALMDYSGRVVAYEYDDYDDLVSVTMPRTRDHPLGRFTRYQYSSDEGTVIPHKLLSVIDSDGRRYVEAEYGNEEGSTDFGKITALMDDDGEWLMEYAQLESNVPATSSTNVLWARMTRPSGDSVTTWLNPSGSITAKDERFIDSDGAPRSAISRFAYNEDGLQVASLSPEGVLTQSVFGREYFEKWYAPGTPTITERFTFGNLLRSVRRAKAGIGFGVNALTGDWRPPNVDADSLAGNLWIGPDDIVQDFTYEPAFQLLASKNDPRKPADLSRRTVYAYSATGELQSINYPATSSPDPAQAASPGAVELFAYDPLHPGRLVRATDAEGHVCERTYHSGVRPPTDLGAFDYGMVPAPLVSIDGHLKSVTHGLGEANAATTTYDVNSRGIVTQHADPRGARTDLTIDADNLPRVITRYLSSGGGLIPVLTKRTYTCEGALQLEKRQLLDDAGAQLLGGWELHFNRYNDSGQKTRQAVGGIDQSFWLVTRFAYTSEGRLAQQVTPGDSVTVYKYDGRGLQTHTIRGFGTVDASTSRVIYDADGRKRAEFDGRNNIKRHLYDGFGRLCATVDVVDWPADTPDSRPIDERQGHVYLRSYDRMDNVTSERRYQWLSVDTYVLRSASEFEYNERGQLFRTKRKLFRQPQPLTTAAGDISALVSATLPADASNVECWQFLDGNGRTVEKRDGVVSSGVYKSAGSSATFVYDYAGRTISTAVQLLRDGLPSLVSFKTDTSYDPCGNPVRVDRYDYELDNTGKTIATEVISKTAQYDSWNRRISETDGLGNTLQYQYDTRDLLMRRIDALGSVTSCEYDLFARKTKTERDVSPSLVFVTTYSYDTNGCLTSITRADSKSASSVSTRFSFDSLLRRTSATRAPGTVNERTTHTRFDGADNVIARIHPNGLVERRKFDQLNRLVRIDYDRSGLPPSETVEGVTFSEYAYDSVGNRIRCANDHSVVKCRYDSLGRMVRETQTVDGTDRVIKRRFDARGNCTFFTYPSGRKLQVEFDLANRVVAIVEKKRGTPDISPPGSGARTLLQQSFIGPRIRMAVALNGTNTRYRYDSSARLTDIQCSASDGTTLLDLGQLHDANGDRRRDWQAGSEALTDSIAYGYDGVRRLRATKRSPKPFPNFAFLEPAGLPVAGPTGQSTIDGLLGALVQQNGADRSYTYDAGGNRLDTKTGGVTHPTSFDVLDQTEGKAFDLASAPRAMGTRKLFFDEQRRIVRATKAGSALLTARYDALGRRVSKVEGPLTRVVVFDGMTEISEYENGSLTAEHVVSRSPDGRVLLCAGKEDYVVHADAVGSVRMITNVQGAVVGRYDFGPFGEKAGGSPLPLNRHTFMGREFDESIGLYHFTARHYHVRLGRFITLDPAEAFPELSPFQAFQSNPFSFVDPLGTRSAKSWAGNLASWWVELDLHYRNDKGGADGWLERKIIDQNDVIFRDEAPTSKRVWAGVKAVTLMVPGTLEFMIIQGWNGLVDANRIMTDYGVAALGAPDLRTSGELAAKGLGKGGILAAASILPIVGLASGLQRPESIQLSLESEELAAAEPIVARPSFWSGVRDYVFQAAKVRGVVRDPTSGAIIEEGENWQMGHLPGYEYEKLLEFRDKYGISNEQFRYIYNNPVYYRPELPQMNAVHAGEAMFGENFYELDLLEGTVPQSPLKP